MSHRLFIPLPAALLVALQFTLAPGLSILFGKRAEIEFGPGVVGS